MTIELGTVFFKPSNGLSIWPGGIRPWWEDFLILRDRCLDLAQSRPRPTGKEWDRIMKLILIPMMEGIRPDRGEVLDQLDRLPVLKGAVEELDLPDDLPPIAFSAVVALVAIGWIARDLYQDWKESP